MSKKLITGGIVATLLASAGAAGIAYAHSPSAADAALSEAQAIEIALAEVPGEIQETELERDDGILVYEIEILTADGVEMEVELNADTGEVLEIEAEDDDDDDDA